MSVGYAAAKPSAQAGLTTQRRLADTQHAAGLGRTHALTSQRLGLLQLHDNLLRRVLRELPHGHPFCPATSSRDYSEQPSHNKRSEKPRPLEFRGSLSQEASAPDPTPNPQVFQKLSVRVRVRRLCQVTEKPFENRWFA